jgi:ABC-type branched-subunit amino acid transport system substrate-binding protein
MRLDEAGRVRRFLDRLRRFWQTRKVVQQASLLLRPPLDVDLDLITPALRGRSARLLGVAALTAMLVGGLFGCPQRGSERTLNLPLLTSEDPDAEAEIRAAREAFEAGHAADAKARYERFLTERPSDPLVAVAHLGIGQIELAEGNATEARTHFAAVVSHPDTGVAERGRFYDGVALHLLGQHREALDALRPFVGRTVDPEETSILFSTIAAASDQIGDRVGAIEALDALTRAPVPEAEKEAARQRIVELVEEPHTPEEIQRAADQLPRDGAAWPLVAQRALRQSFEAGDLARVHALAEALRHQGVDLDEELTAMAVRADRSQDADPRTIGAILPLSGRGREVGQLALKGLVLAAGGPAEGPAGADAPQVVFRDDGGDPARAVRAVEELVSLHRVIAIVGPLTGPTSEAAARRAQELGVPLIALSPNANVAATGPMVFRLFVTPQGESRDLVQAASRRGARRFAVFHPDTAYGTAMADAFESAVRAAGGEPVARVSYPAEATAFGREMEALAATPFDALFVPDSARKIALVAPALASAGLWCMPEGSTPPRNGRVITLLLPSVGFGADLPRSSGRYLSGALFSVPFYAPTATGAGRTFADAFAVRYGTAPDAFAAYAYDAGQMIRTAVGRGAATRTAVQAELAGMRAFDTAAPSAGFTDRREPVRATRILELRGTGFVPLEAPPPSSK